MLRTLRAGQDAEVKRRLEVMLGLALLGAAVAAYLTYVAIWRHGEAFCTGVGDCQRVQTSEYSRVAGIPVAAFGLAMYLGLVTMLVLRRMRPAWWPQRLAVWTAALALTGTAYSAYLTWLELAVIDAICVWCVTSAAIVTVLAVVAVIDLVRARGVPASEV